MLLDTFVSDVTMIPNIIIAIITLIVLFIASYTDVKTREVPDWLSFSFMIIILLLQILFSIEYGWKVIISAIIGLFVYFLLALLFYYTDQWGGADSKLLIGMGLVLGADFIFGRKQYDLIIYLVLLFLFAAFVGLFWSTILAIKYHKKFTHSFGKLLTEYKKEHIGVAAATFVMVVLGFFVHEYIFLIALFPLIAYYAFVYLHSIEDSCFIKQIMPHKLTLGDWLYKDVKIGRKTIVASKTLEREDIHRLMQLEAEDKIKTVEIKEGIPLVPSFFLAYVGLLLVNYFVGIF
jgi:Flp pilus assembly protein protease CpaA